MAREPRAVRGGHHPIPATVQEKGLSGDVGGVEAPRANACEIVDDPWANTHKVDCRYASSKNTSGD
jgi:hypothetical protein